MASVERAPGATMPSEMSVTLSFDRNILVFHLCPLSRAACSKATRPRRSRHLWSPPRLGVGASGEPPGRLEQHDRLVFRLDLEASTQAAKGSRSLGRFTGGAMKAGDAGSTIRRLRIASISRFVVA